MAVYPYKDGTTLEVSGNGVYFGDSVPTTGDFNVGDLMIVVSNTNAVTQSYPLMYRCVTASSSHNGGTWAAVGQAVGVGALIASAATIVPTYPVHHISGTTPISTITVPTGWPNGGILTLVPDSAYTTNISGNLSSTSTAVVGRAMTFVWDVAKSVWYNSY